MGHLRPLVARALVGQRHQALAHFAQFADVPVDLRHLLQRARLHVGAVAGRIVEQRHQLAALVQVEAHLPRLAQQRQLFNVPGGIMAVTVIAADRGGNQRFLFVKRIVLLVNPVFFATSLIFIFPP